MQNEVTVNGITLTRAQVETALKELNKPAIPKTDITVVAAKDDSQFSTLRIVCGAIADATIITRRNYGTYANKALYLPQLASGFKWVAEEDGSGEGAHTKLPIWILRVAAADGK